MEFAILPDGPGAGSTARSFICRRRIDHPSGRPWVVGDWGTDEVAVVQAGNRKLLLFGKFRPRDAVTPTMLARLRTLSDVDALAGRLPGLFHLLVSIDGCTRAQGSVVGAHQIFTANLGGMTVAASGVAPLLRLVAAPLDETVLAAQLLVPGGAPWPVAQRPVRRGIEPLLAGCWLEIDAAGRSRQIRWWNLPPANETLDQGADALGSALSASIAARTGAGKAISADLSGGLDSTSLCFLAVDAGAELSTYHVEPLDRANQDTAWARRAARAMPGARHHVLSADRPENLFDAGHAADSSQEAAEGPMSWASGLAHVRDLARRAAGAGATTHLTGFGGDELFGRIPACAWSLMRSRPLEGLRLVNRYRLANRWSWRATGGALLDRSGFADGLRSVADGLDAPPPPPGEPDFGWVPALRMPSWATPDANAAVRQVLKMAADTGFGALDDDRTRHQALASLVYEGTTLRQIATVLSGAGITWDAPLLDDRVIEAALAVKVEQRLASGRFKPLLVEAVRGSVPGYLLARRDKGEFSAETYRGLERNRDRILELTEDSQLAALGLIDPAAFRAAILNPGPHSHHLQPIATTVATESWLRAHARPLNDPVLPAPPSGRDLQDTGDRR